MPSGVVQNSFIRGFPHDFGFNILLTRADGFDIEEKTAWIRFADWDAALK